MKRILLVGVMIPALQEALLQIAEARITTNKRKCYGNRTYRILQQRDESHL